MKAISRNKKKTLSSDLCERSMNQCLLTAAPLLSRLIEATISFQEESDQALQELEVQLLDAGNILRSRLHYCTANWREEDFPRDHLRSDLVTVYW